MPDMTSQYTQLRVHPGEATDIFKMEMSTTASHFQVYAGHP